MNVSHLKYIPPKYTIINSRNPADYFKMMKLYSKERNDRFVNLSAFFNGLNSIISGCGLRTIKDNSNNLLVAYTYRLRKNKLEQKSLFIDALVRNRSENTNLLMCRIYNDMKNIALKKQAKELTCYSVASDRALRSKYEKLGFKIDPKVDILHGYIMRCPIKEFTNSKWFQTEYYKEMLGIKKILNDFW